MELPTLCFGQYNIYLEMIKREAGIEIVGAHEVQVSILATKNRCLGPILVSFSKIGQNINSVYFLFSKLHIFNLLQPL